MRKSLALALVLLASGTGQAADKDGRFMRGGGIGSVGCPTFLNATASARQAGGLQMGGVGYVNSYLQFVEGFRTGFNSEHNGVFDIFAPLETGTSGGFDVLYAIEPWCQQHPEGKFSEGVLALVAILLKNAK